jgi:hypothetical protein
MKQISTVEWLVEQLDGERHLTENEIKRVIEQAKEMEQEQLAKSYIKGSSDAVDDLWEFMNQND